MERPRVTLEAIRQTARRLEKPALAACAATALLACGGNFPGPETLRKELIEKKPTDGRGYTLIMTNRDVPVVVGFIGDGPTGVSEAGILPKDTMVKPVIVFDAGHGEQTAAFPCAQVKSYLNSPWSETPKQQLKDIMCYVFEGKHNSFTAADY